MRKSRFFNRFTISFLVVVVVGGIFLSSCFTSGRYSSNGERIYFTAESASGQPITSTGGIRMMHAIACVNCHGPEGKGGRVDMMMYHFNSPNITWHVLTQEEEHEEAAGNGEHKEHPPYTEVTLKRAITEGVDPAGERLDDEMPRWRMSEQDLNDLVEFIKILD